MCAGTYFIDISVGAFVADPSEAAIVSSPFSFDVVAPEKLSSEHYAERCQVKHYTADSSAAQLSSYTLLTPYAEVR